MKYREPGKIGNRRKARLYAGIVIVAAFYFAALAADFLAPYDYREQSRREPSAPASVIRLRDAEGSFNFRPRVYANRLINPVTQQYSVDESQSASLHFFVRGYSYKLLGFIPSDMHLFGLSNEQGGATKIHLLGTDALGRDRFSRLLLAIRFSLIVSPVGTILASVLGIFIGIISGYSRRLIDSALMGISNAVLSLPSLIVILAARVAFPLELPPLAAAALLIGIFAFTGWAEMALLTRGLVKSMREREFVLAATATGVTPMRILFRHILPNISRPLLTQATLMLPVFLLAEAALSFLGVGLQEPEPSLGNMLTAAGDFTQLQHQPFLLLSPAIIIFLFVLGLRLLSDGLSESR